MSHLLIGFAWKGGRNLRPWLGQMLWKLGGIIRQVLARALMRASSVSLILRLVAREKWQTIHPLLRVVALAFIGESALGELELPPVFFTGDALVGFQ